MSSSRWPSLTYLQHRDSRASKLEAKKALLNHCLSCGCMFCLLRLARMSDEIDVREAREALDGLSVEVPLLDHLVN